jgi:hypothetical protein
LKPIIVQGHREIKGLEGKASLESACGTVHSQDTIDLTTSFDYLEGILVGPQFIEAGQVVEQVFF